MAKSAEDKKMIYMLAMKMRIQLVFAFGKLMNFLRGIIM